MRYGIPKHEKIKVFSRDKWRCLRCRSKKKLTVDHILPKAHGGSDDIDNLQTLCRYCNEQKGKNSVKDYRNSKALPAMDMGMKCKMNGCLEG